MLDSCKLNTNPLTLLFAASIKTELLIVIAVFTPENKFTLNYYAVKFVAARVPPLTFINALLPLPLVLISLHKPFIRVTSVEMLTIKFPPLDKRAPSISRPSSVAMEPWAYK